MSKGINQTLYLQFIKSKFFIPFDVFGEYFELKKLQALNNYHYSKYKYLCISISYCVDL